MSDTDVCRSRHGGNPESEFAFLDLCNTLPRQRAEVLSAIRGVAGGITCKELAAEWEVGMNEISGRFTELKRAGLISKIGVRNGSAVMQITSKP